MKGTKVWNRHSQKVIQVVHELMEKILGFLPPPGGTNLNWGFHLAPTDRVC